MRVVFAFLAAAVVVAVLPAYASAEKTLPFPPIVFNLERVAPATRSYVEELKVQSRHEHIADSREWRSIGHYRKSWGHQLSEIDGLDFFLSPQGVRDPQAELEATLDAFSELPSSENEDSHAQCRYPSRRRYLNRALHFDPQRLPQHACAKLNAWKKRLDADGLSLIFASAYLNNAGSMFGHTFLKFHGRANKDDRDLLNYGVNFSAHTGGDGGAFFALRGLTGGYRGYFSLLPYHQTLHEYANLEGRDVWEYRLSLTQDEVDALIDHLLEIQQTWFDYYFLDENCSYQLLAALEVARPSLDLSNKLSFFVIPADSVRLIAREPGLVTATRYRRSLATEFRQSVALIDVQQRALAKRLALDDADMFANDLATLQGEPAVKAQTLDAALLFASILAEKKPADWASRDHRLKIARAALGVPTPPQDAEPRDARRPEEGHDSSLVGVGFGRREDFNFSSVQVRAAYQDLLSRDVGFLQNTRLEILRTEFRRRSGTDAIGDLRLQELTLIDLFAATPWSRFFKPLSWQARVGWNRPDDLPWQSSLALTASGGAGVAFAPFGEAPLSEQRLTLVAMGVFNADIGDGVDLGYRLGVGVQAQAIGRILAGWHVGAGSEYRRYFLGGTKEVPVFWARTTVALSRNWEARLQHQRTAEITENQAWVAWHFLF